MRRMVKALPNPAGTASRATDARSPGTFVDRGVQPDPSGARTGGRHPAATAISAFKSREVEERHLREAEEHIARGEQRICALEQHINEAQNRGDDVTSAQATLAITMDVLQTFIAHRRRILLTLGDIDAGRCEAPSLPAVGPRDFEKLE